LASLKGTGRDRTPKSNSDWGEIMKATLTEDASGIRFEIQDDGSVEYQKAWNIVKDANAKEEESRQAMSGMSLDKPVAWAVMTDSGLESVNISEAVAADRAMLCGGEAVPLYSRGRPFIAARESIGGLLNAIKRFIDQTDPWVSQVVDRDYKIITPESRNARMAFAELCKRLKKT
jgi:hypothetical protein